MPLDEFLDRFPRPRDEIVRLALAHGGPALRNALFAAVPDLVGKAKDGEGTVQDRPPRRT